MEIINSIGNALEIIFGVVFVILFSMMGFLLLYFEIKDEKTLKEE
jgi:hypothetical protein